MLQHFGFVRETGGSYSADLPPELLRHQELVTAVRLGVVARTLQFRNSDPVDIRPSNPSARSSSSGPVQHWFAGGNHFATWRFGTWNAWLATRADTETDLFDAAMSLLKIEPDSGGVPRASCSGDLAFDDPGDPINRDRAFFYGPDSGVPWSVSFMLSRGMSSPSSKGYPSAYVASSQSPLGIDVVVDGPKDAAADLEVLARQISATLSRVA